MRRVGAIAAAVQHYPTPLSDPHRPDTYGPGDAINLISDGRTPRRGMKERSA